MFIILTLLLQTIAINNHPNKNIQFKFNYLFSLGVDDNDGYYDTATLFYSKDSYIVFDKGNSRIIIYNDTGQIKSEFGEEGNGPNQLSNTKIKVIQNRILAIKRSYISLFDFKGIMINTMKVDPKRKAFVVESDMGFIVYYKKYNKGDILFSEYSLDAKLIKSKKADKEIKRQNLDVPIDESLKRFIINEYNTKSDYIYFDKHYFNFQEGEFKLEKYSIDLNESAAYKYQFNRISIDDKLEKNHLYSKGKRDLALEEKVNTFRRDIYQGYVSDIVSINGVNSGNLFVSLEAKSNSERETIILNKEMMSVGKFKFHKEDLKSWTVSEGRLLAYFKNDEIGPYFKIYNLISIN